MIQHKTDLSTFQIQLIEDTNKKLGQKVTELQQILQILTNLSDLGINTSKNKPLNRSKSRVFKLISLVGVLVLLLVNIALNGFLLAKMQFVESETIQKYQKGLVIGFDKAEKITNPKEVAKVRKIIIDEIDNQLKTP